MNNNKQIYFFSAVGRVHITREPPYMMAYLEYCKNRGMIMRSGGALGADKMFTDAYVQMGGRCEIMLPWNGSNGYFMEDSTNQVSISCTVSKQDYESWEPLRTKEESSVTRVLNARNVSIHAGCDFCLFVDDTYDENSGTQCGLRVCHKLGISTINILEVPFVVFRRLIESENVLG